jgi:hypothetical protein
VSSDFFLRVPQRLPGHGRQMMLLAIRDVALPHGPLAHLPHENLTLGRPFSEQSLFSDPAAPYQPYQPDPAEKDNCTF